jgi:FlaA1/EpsC-like NDP-sugar epimerase
MSEYAETFVLDMGQPVPIVDLVRKYAQELHLPDVTIRFTGLRPGEKLTEKVFSDSEVRLPTAHPKIWATRGAEGVPAMSSLLDLLYCSAEVNDAEGTRRLLRDLLPEYQPTTYPQTPASVGAPYPDGF